jgi:hypothetical protein
VTTYRLKGTSGAVVNQAYPLDGRLVLGRADDCDVRIDHDSVAPRHAEVSMAGEGGVVIRDLGSGLETRVNGEPVGEARLSGGDEIQVGNCRLMLQAPGLRPERVLGAEPGPAVGGIWKWLVPVAIVAAAALAWYFGYLEIPGTGVQT